MLILDEFISREINLLKVDRRNLSRTNRQLQAKGFGEFVRMEEEKTLRRNRKITKEIAHINTRIDYLKNSGTLINIYKLEEDAAKRDYIKSIHGRKK
ncbi:hypothetical protein [Desulfocucumis palustris]|nr:hypothetical protein [Desulfocucumis palustris]